MDFELNEEQRIYRESVRKFAEKEVKPVAMEFDRKSDPRDCVPLDLYRKGFEQGFHQMMIPAAYGGTGLDAVTTLVILEELAAADAGYATTWHVNNITLTTLLNMGSEAQAERFIRPIVEGPGGVSSLSTTEPDGGVTSALMVDPLNFVFKTTARLEGDEWVIDGAKSYCSNAGLPFAKWAMVFCRTDMGQKGWGSTKPILVPLDAPGVIFAGEEDKMGQRLSNTQSLTFDNVRVPKDYAIGAGGRPIAGGARRVTYEHDSAIAAISVGCARAAYEEALAWAKQREVLGKPIIQYQLIQAKIADMFIGLEAARCMAYRAASYSDTHNVMDLKLARAAKVFASETANRVVYDALQVLGGMGYCKGTVTEKCYRDQRVTTIYEGTNEAQRISISRLIEAGA
jgi:alkylation response protein AidB-like acyl-CoA dehydrogenase